MVLDITVEIPKQANCKTQTNIYFISRTSTSNSESQYNSKLRLLYYIIVKVIKLGYDLPDWELIKIKLFPK